MTNSFSRCAADRRAHDRLWSSERVEDADGLSRFQHRAQEALRAAGFPLHDMTIEPLRGGGPADLFVTGLVGPASVRVYLYAEGVELRSDEETLSLESWDTRGPEDMLTRLIGRLRALVDTRPGLHPESERTPS